VQVDTVRSETLVATLDSVHKCARAARAVERIVQSSGERHEQDRELVEHSKFVDQSIDKHTCVPTCLGSKRAPLRYNLRNLVHCLVLEAKGPLVLQYVLDNTMCFTTDMGA